MTDPNKLFRLCENYYSSEWDKSGDKHVLHCQATCLYGNQVRITNEKGTSTICIKDGLVSKVEDPNFNENAAKVLAKAKF
ncbi:MAG: hypothetical protein WC781_01895 [Candidatus Pacearchaeota archaeon]|jgi:hypothetical protein